MVAYADGSPDPIFGYKALAFHLSAVSSLCAAEHGKLTPKSHAQVGARTAPTMLICEGANSTLWGLEIEYRGVSTYTNVDQSTWLELAIDSTAISGARFTAAKAAEAERIAQGAANARERERALAIRAVNFRAQLKAGDRFQYGQNITGIVIRVEGELAFVQFDNATIGGQPTRYVPRAEIWPIE